MVKYHTFGPGVCCESIPSYGQNKESFVTMPDFLFASEMSVRTHNFFNAKSGINASVKSAPVKSAASAIEPEKYAPCQCYLLS